MKLLTAEDEAKFYQYVPTHTISPFSTRPKLTLLQRNSQKRHNRRPRRPSSRLRWRLRRRKTLRPHPQPHTAIQSLPRSLNRLLRRHHLRRPRRPRLRENQPPRPQLPQRAPGPARQAARRPHTDRARPALGEREQIFHRRGFVGGQHGDCFRAREQESDEHGAETRAGACLCARVDYGGCDC
jgi:hypothetical protein